MQNIELIKMLLEYPMDMEIAVGLPKGDGTGELDIWAINTVEILDIKLDGGDEEPLIILFHEELTDHTLN